MVVIARERIKEESGAVNKQAINVIDFEKSNIDCAIRRGRLGQIGAVSTEAVIFFLLSFTSIIPILYLFYSFLVSRSNCH
jgi:hypothetical protein